MWLTISPLLTMVQSLKLQLSQIKIEAQMIKEEDQEGRNRIIEAGMEATAVARSLMTLRIQTTRNLGRAVRDQKEGIKFDPSLGDVPVYYI
jgi:hypothetical protein